MLLILLAAINNMAALNIVVSHRSMGWQSSQRVGARPVEAPIRLAGEDVSSLLSPFMLLYKFYRLAYKQQKFASHGSEA